MTELDCWTRFEIILDRNQELKVSKIVLIKSSSSSTRKRGKNAGQNTIVMQRERVTESMRDGEGVCGTGVIMVVRR